MKIQFKKYKRAIIALFLFFTIFPGCENPVSVKANLNEEFKLKIGEEALINGADLYIKLISVLEDSRCPLEFRCVWSGNAEVVVKLRRNLNTAIKSSLNTHIQPRELEFSDYKIRLITLDPYPLSDESIPQVSYTATFLVDCDCN